VRSLEILQACEEALNLVENYEPADPAETTITTFTATGFGCTEAPRGLCWHRYRLDDSGLVLDARIVPPTAQNLKVIEGDVRALAEKCQDLPLDRLKWKCEQLVRSYDPCISCSCHMLTVR
jgi:sulfhydrogenase subunit alpha